MRSFLRSVAPAFLVVVLGACATTDRSGGTIREVAGEERRQMPLRPDASVSTPATRMEPSRDRFAASVRRIDAEVISRMGTSWQPGCPVALEELRVIALTHWGFDGHVHAGEMMVHHRHAAAVTHVFSALFEARFPIERMELANGYMGNDPPLAQRNNTVGFNCRAPVGGGGPWSEHAYGRAIDINPERNPYVSRSGRVEPLFGGAYRDRSLTAAGMIQPNDPVVRAFRAIGWRWGGAWRGTKDYMHFSATGR